MNDHELTQEEEDSPSGEKGKCGWGGGGDSLLEPVAICGRDRNTATEKKWPLGAQCFGKKGVHCKRGIQ